MMKYIAPTFVIFALLTDPQGHTIYVMKSQVIAVTEPHGCDPNAHAKIFTSISAMCVAEDVVDVMNKVSAP